MAILYVTSGAWGSGVGRLLQPNEIDGNFYQVAQDIAAKAVQGVGIDHFTITGSDLYVYLTDATILGPYPLPVATIKFVGTWLPHTQYYVNEIFTFNGSTYIVLFNHMSEATFDPNANDGHGDQYYGLLLSNPTMAIPAGGAAGQVLEKATGADYSLVWAWPTFQTLQDVLPAPAPVRGELVYWNGSAFSYIPQSSVVAQRQSYAFPDLTDVIDSPGPSSGDLVYWNGAGFTYIAQTSINAAPQPMAFTGLTDVLASPAPGLDQIVYWNGTAFTYETLTTALLTDNHFGSLAQWDQSYYDLANTRWVNRQPPPIYNSGWSGTFTLALFHAQNLLDIATGGAITIPAHATIAFTVGTPIWLRAAGTSFSPFSFTAASGVTLNVPPGRIAQPRALGSVVLLQQTSTLDTWEISGDLAFDSAPVTLPGSGGFNFDSRLYDVDVYNWTVTGSGTVNTVSGGAPFGKRITFIITSGSSGGTITWGANFKSEGSLSSGAAGKVSVIMFIGDGTNFNEVSRSLGM